MGTIDEPGVSSPGPEQGDGAGGGPGARARQAAGRISGAAGRGGALRCWLARRSGRLRWYSRGWARRMRWAPP